MKGWMLFMLLPLAVHAQKPDSSWIRINQLGYLPGGVKVAVWASKKQLAVGSTQSAVNNRQFEVRSQQPAAKSQQPLLSWQLVDALTGKFATTGKSAYDYGAYGPFVSTYRIDFSGFKRQGRYFLQAEGAKSPVFTIGDDVYKGTADFCLRYMRQQRSGFNPFLKDSCHTHDGYTLYGKHADIEDSTFVDVSGGWHDASDYLQYSTTSANATYHLLMAYHEFPQVFGDTKQANGLEGSNGAPDVLDEANWGIKWLLKMNPAPYVMFNQLGDDRDHMGMRIPKEDSFYGRGFERPVYFLGPDPQQRGKFMNNTKGTSSSAAKFSSVFSFAHYLEVNDPLFKKYSDQTTYYDKAMVAWDYARKYPGVTQTASVRSPYIYAEDNWVDDMELAAASLHRMVIHNPGSGDNDYFTSLSYDYAQQEKITPWLGADTAKHYQWYPFINLGHRQLAEQLPFYKYKPKERRDTITGYYKEGIERVWQKARTNAFYRGVPFIWCSNNLTTSFAIQCYWYRQLTHDNSYAALEQANIDWLFGCNPWGTSMVYGLPGNGDTPVDPHSAFTHLKNYPIDGGLVDGPVYGSIYKGLIGIQLKDADEYAAFQSDLAVYHDDYGDYSSNEPTMDGTASLIYLLGAKETEAIQQAKGMKPGFTYDHGAITRGDTLQRNITLVFTGDEFGDGGDKIEEVLAAENVKASFFLTGRFYRNPAFKKTVQRLKQGGHYLGVHSDQHLLYCDWSKRDSLLVTKQQFIQDLRNSYKELMKAGVPKKNAPYFLPPYEWYNDSIAKWTREEGLQLINFTPGSGSNADYTTPSDKNYRSSDKIHASILQYAEKYRSGLNGFILLLHIGTAPERTDKMYDQLPQLLKELKAQGYQFQTLGQQLRD